MSKRRREDSREVLRISLCGLLTALTYIFLAVGSVFEAFEFCAVLFASFPILFCMIEMGTKYAVPTWLASSLVAFLLLPGSKFSALVYFLFGGMYPILKPYFHKLKRPLPLVAKLLYIAVDFVIIYFLSSWLFPADEESGMIFAVIFALLTVVTFFLYDFLLGKITEMYFWKWRKLLRIKDLK